MFIHLKKIYLLIIWLEILFYGSLENKQGSQKLHRRHLISKYFLINNLPFTIPSYHGAVHDEVQDLTAIKLAGCLLTKSY